MKGAWPARLAGLLVAAFVLVAGSAMQRTSTTFDEIVFPAAGARGIASGDFSMVNDHPRLAQYAYGLPLYLSGVRYPPEEGYGWNWYTRYQYAEALYWASGNSGEAVAFSARLVGLAFGALTVLAVFLLARRHMAPGAALFAAALVAFVPDMLAHSGVAYNDVPVTFGVLVGAYALDAMVREPTLRRAALAGLAFALTASMKYSGLILLPVLAALLALEGASGRWRDAAWRGALLRGAGVFVATVYAVICLLYGGDWTLGGYTAGLGELWSSTLARARPVFLLGERRVGGGWWYFFPVSFALKTPMALHVLALIAVVAAALSARGGAWRAWAAHGARAPAVGAALMLAAAMASRMSIGMRHVLPLMPFACILVAQGVAWACRRGDAKVRALAAVCLVAMAGSTLRHYPWFLSYLSEYAYGRPLHETLVDSNTDWGHGLIGLREFMQANRVDRVALGYFGTALPQGYGVDFVPLPSYFQLRGESQPGPPPRYIVVSATLLAGNYVGGDPYAELRKAEPVAVVGGSLYVFDRLALEKR